MNLIQITQVRLDDNKGREAIGKYVFGGHYGPVRVPRGVKPEVASQFLRKTYKADTDAEDFPKALAVMRFYECIDLMDHFAPMLVPRLSDDEALTRQAVVCQMLGDLGDAPQAKLAAEHFNRVLVPHPNAVLSHALMLETLLVLAPSGNTETYTARVGAEVTRLEPDQRKSEPAMMEYDKVAAIKRNEIPRTNLLIEQKKKLAEQKPPDRRVALVKLYLGQGAVSHPYLQIWAARMLRQEAMVIGPQPVVAEFGKVLDGVPAEKIGKDKATDVTVNRCAYAIRYFQRPLTEEQLNKRELAQTRTMDFLDDSD